MIYINDNRHVFGDFNIVNLLFNTLLLYLLKPIFEGFTQEKRGCKTLFFALVYGVFVLELFVK